MRHLSSPFRLFFLLAGGAACAFIAAWYLALSGRITIASELGAMGWHAHEMVFGYIGAILAGFLLTAAASWTGLPTVGGRGVVALMSLWIAARAVHATRLSIPGEAAIELVFFCAVAVGIGRPIVKARRWKNIGFVVLMLVMGLGDFLIHQSAKGSIGPQWATRGLWVSIDAVALIILLFAGRILPLFTKGALSLAKVRPRGPLDIVGLGIIGLLLVAHAFSVRASVEALLWAGAGDGTIARLYGWGGSKTLHTPLLWVLHLGWFLVGAGMLLVALALVAPRAIQNSAAHHLLFVGGFGVLSLGMMARVALGHTGREKKASRLATGAFVLLLVATAARVVASLLRPALYVDTIFVAAAAWCAAFLIFLWVYGPVLLTPRPDGKPG